MRDGTILEGFQRITDAISDDLAKVTRTNAMLRTRIDALEGVLLGSRFGLLKMALAQLISPALVARMIQARHADEIVRFNAIRAQATKERPRIVKAPTDGLISVH